MTFILINFNNSKCSIRKKIGTEPVTSLIHYKRLIIQLDLNNTSQNGSDEKPSRAVSKSRDKWHIQNNRSHSVISKAIRSNWRHESMSV